MRKINRRTFIKSTAALGGLAYIGVRLFPKILSAQSQSNPVNIYSVSGNDPMGNIKKLISAHWGIEKFIRPGNSVGFLVNSPWKTAGNYTHPDVVLSMIKLCKDAGASEIIVFKPVRSDYWKESQYYEKLKPLINEIKYSGSRRSVAIKGGKTMKEAEVFDDFMNVDVCINIPVAKHHNGTVFSGMLKGLMGVTTSGTNRYMHSPDGKYTYGKPRYLSQCIADLGLVRKPDLCIFDAIECSVDNGPRGPSKIVNPNKILAGTDPLAMDVYAAELIGFYPEDVPTFQKSYENGLGEMDSNKFEIVEV